MLKLLRNILHQTTNLGTRNTKTNSFFNILHFISRDQLIQIVNIPLMEY